ncbi:MAG: hypothetical protein IPL78_15465 [Chloroflexi bacterium]|nr:hypothetical protein [Chloroflexota bacterium]
MLDTLLATKLYCPPPRPDVVMRPRLLQHLERSLTCPLTLVSAPAGYGKTTLVSTWLHQYAAAASGSGESVVMPAWSGLSLDEADNDPYIFGATLSLLYAPYILR